ncbi:unnamed protein product [Phytomonas sp. EM1]|nr:unnamed protein product [Phytomonas sp. EM1]|eukprot:CCW62724.1 unnamed protein product [Phytomonas sp. isolate EM1]
MKRFPYLFLIIIALFSAFLFEDALAELPCHYKTQRLECGKLACNKTKNICINCTEDADCYPAAMECILVSGKCRVKPLKKGFSYRTVLAMLGGLVVCAIGVISGAGGGGILVPLYAASMQLPLETAVGISQVTVCGQSVLNVYMSSQRKFVDTMWDRPLINYQYLSLLLPLGLLGTLFGILNTILPDILRLIFLFSLLLIVLYRTIKKTLKQYKEDKRRRNAMSPCETNFDSSQPFAETQATPEEPVIHRIPQEQYPIKNLLTYVFYFIVLLVSGIIRVYCRCGGVAYWLSVIVPALILLGGFCYTYYRLNQLHSVCPDAITFKWGRKTALYFPLVAILAGAAGAILGIGGGMVLGFILYEINLIPDEVSVTSNVVTCFIALTSSIRSLLKGDIPYDFAIVFCLVGVVSTLLGNMVFLKYIRKHGLKFLIIMCLVLVVVGSLVATGTYGIFDLLDKKDSAGIFKFGKLCIPQ